MSEKLCSICFEVEAVPAPPHRAPERPPPHSNEYEGAERYATYVGYRPPLGIPRNHRDTKHGPANPLRCFRPICSRSRQPRAAHRLGFAHPRRAIEDFQETDPAMLIVIVLTRAIADVIVSSPCPRCRDQLAGLVRADLSRFLLRNLIQRDPGAVGTWGCVDSARRMRMSKRCGQSHPVALSLEISLIITCRNVR